MHPKDSARGCHRRSETPGPIRPWRVCSSLGSSTLREVDAVYSTSACKDVHFAEVVDQPEASPLQCLEHSCSCLVRAELRVDLDHERPAVTLDNLALVLNEIGLQPFDVADQGNASPRVPLEHPLQGCRHDRDAGTAAGNAPREEAVGDIQRCRGGARVVDRSVLDVKARAIQLALPSQNWQQFWVGFHNDVPSRIAQAAVHQRRDDPDSATELHDRRL